MSQTSKFITIIRPEFMEFCGDACRAAALNHLFYRIAGKCKDQPKEKIQAGEILWYAKTELIKKEMSDAWGECKIRQEVNGLVDMGLIGRTKDPNWGVNRTKHFFFGTEQCAKFLELCEEHGICFVHLDLPDEVKHLIYSSNANDKSIKCICKQPEMVDANDKSIKCNSYIHQVETMNISNANDKSIEAITKNTTKINNIEDYEERESTAPESHTPVSPPSVGALTLPSKAEEFIEKLREWRIEDEQQGDAHATLPPGSADRADTLPGADMGDLPASGQDLRSLSPASRMALETGEEEIDASKQTTPTLSPAQTPPPQSEQAASGQASKGKGKKTAEPAPKCDTREIQQRINEHRGYALEERVELIRERQAVKTWCNLHTLDEFEQVLAGLKHDPYWGKAENYYRIGGLTLLKETSRILALKATEYRLPTRNETPSVLGASGLPRWTATGMPLQVLSASARR